MRVLSVRRELMIGAVLALCSSAVSASVLGVDFAPRLHGQISDGGTTANMGDPSAPSVGLAPGQSYADSTAVNISNSPGSASLSGGLNLTTTANSVSGSGSLTGSAINRWTSGFPIGYALFQTSMAGFSGLQVDLGSPGSAFTFNYSIDINADMLGRSGGQLYYQIALGQSHNWFQFMNVQDAFQYNGTGIGMGSSFNDGVSGSLSGTSDYGDLMLFINIQMGAGGGVPFYEDYDVNALGQFSFDITTAGGGGSSSVPLPGTLWLLMPALLGLVLGVRRGRLPA